jgi:DNA polymerase elongation subunit (family B)
MSNKLEVGCRQTKGVTMADKMLINCYQSGGNEVTHLYTMDGTAHVEKIRFKPFLGVHATSKETTSWTDIYGKPVKVIVFDSMQASREWKKQNSGLLDILGDVSPVVQYMATQYRKDIVLKMDGVVVWNIDIEVCNVKKDPSIKGFPSPQLAKVPISAITIQDMVKNTYITIACGDYKSKLPNVEYIRCGTEEDLLRTYIRLFNEHKPHIITGWNIKLFDIPYIVNRTNRILGPEDLKKLSIDRVVKQHESEVGNKTEVTFTLQGTIIWDYIELYKKYIGEPRESFSLNFISQYELGLEKVSYTEEHETLEGLYFNDFEKYIDYNIQDVALVYELNCKFRFLELAMSITHKAKCPPEAIFGTVQPWDCIFYNELLATKKLCPSNGRHDKQDYVGGFVMDVKSGMYTWTKVKDIVSSYPNQIRSFNMSPETIINDKELPNELRVIRDVYGSIDACVDIEKLANIQPILEKYGVSFTSNGHFFRTDKEGFIPSIYTKIFNQRVQHKKEQKIAKEAGNKELAGQLHLIQYAEKILLNSGYGALGNQHSRYFDIRIAEAITSNGQVCVKGAAKFLKDKLNIETFYSDTDSVFLDLDPFVNKRFKELPDKATILDFILKLDEKVIAPCVDSFFEEMRKNMNMRELTIFMEAECVAETTIMVAKKKYIMNKVWDEGTFHLENPKQKIRGVEIVRTSTPAWVRKKLKEAVNMIFETKDNAKLIEFIGTVKNEFMELPFETIAFPRGVTFSNYNLQSKSLPIAVRAAFVYNKHLREKNLQDKYPLIEDGDKLKFCFIQTPNRIHSNVVGISNKFPQEMSYLKIDYPLQFKKTFIDPLENIFESIGWEYESKNSLEEFFS